LFGPSGRIDANLAVGSSGAKKPSKGRDRILWDANAILEHYPEVVLRRRVATVRHSLNLAGGCVVGYLFIGGNG
jgi:hypothetical protein